MTCKCLWWGKWSPWVLSYSCVHRQKIYPSWWITRSEKNPRPNCFAILVWIVHLIGQPVDRFIRQFVISHNFAHWKTWDELFNMIIEFDTSLLIIFTGIGLVKGENEACYTSSFSGRKLVSVPQESSSQTTHLLLGFNEIEELYHCEFMGWNGLWLLNILHNNISKIADYAFLNLNQLRELDISNNAIVNLPVNVFQGLIF